MKFKDVKDIVWVKTETGNSFGMNVRFNDNKAESGYFVGSHGDIFPYSQDDLDVLTPAANEEVSIECMQKFFNTKVVAVSLNREDPRNDRRS